MATVSWYLKKKKILQENIDRGCVSIIMHNRAAHCTLLFVLYVSVGDNPSHWFFCAFDKHQSSDYIVGVCAVDTPVVTMRLMSARQNRNQNLVPFREAQGISSSSCSSLLPCLSPLSFTIVDRSITPIDPRCKAHCDRHGRSPMLCGISDYSWIQLKSNQLYMNTQNACDRPNRWIAMHQLRWPVVARDLLQSLCPLWRLRLSYYRQSRAKLLAVSIHDDSDRVIIGIKRISQFLINSFTYLSCRM